MEQRNNIKIFGQSVNLLLGIAVIIIFLLGSYLLLWGIYNLFYNWITITLLAAAILIIDYKVLLRHINWLTRLIKKNTPVGVAMTVVNLLGLPFVLLFLLAKAGVKKQIEKNKSTTYKQDGEYIDFEELDSKPLDFPEVREEKKQSDY